MSDPLNPGTGAPDAPLPPAPPASLRIALLEDAADFAEQMMNWLQEAGHRCQWHGTAADFKRQLSRESVDLVLLDRQLPDGRGEDVMAWLRRTQDSPVPVIFVTSMGDEREVAQILDLGADDYLVKPVRRLELLARVRACARRRGAEASLLAVGNLVVDVAQRRVLRDGEPLELGSKEFAILVLMMRNLGRLLSREQIYETAWGRPMAGTTRTVDTYVSQLRTRAGLTLERGWRLTSVYQRGYRLEPLLAATGAAPLGG